MSSLNPQQHAAVTHTGTPCLVLAGAGSGKTRVITQKIAWLLQERAIPARQITAVTFTNKAAREMKQRVQETLPDSVNKRGLSISTFHRFGLNFIRREAQALGLNKQFSVIDPDDSMRIIAELLKANLNANGDLIKNIHGKISNWKNLGLLPETIPTDISNPTDVAAAAVYGEYQRYLRTCSSVDLDDLILLPLNALTTDNELQMRWQARTRYLLVDEYQDTNGAQYNLIKQLAGNGKGLTVVGDDDQSIYAWRGAQPENLSQLEVDFPKLELIKLEQNYRSFGRILKVANHLISNNPRPFEKRLWSDLGYGDPIRVVSAVNEEQEAEKVVSDILTRQFQDKADHRDFAILYRSNHQARALETKLREMRIPYKLSGGLSFFDRAEIKDIMGYLRVLANPQDDTALQRIINLPRRGIGASSLEKAAALANQREQSLFDTLLEDDLDSFVRPQAAQAMREFAQRMVKLNDNAERGSVIGSVRDLLNEISYQEYLEENNELPVAERRWQNVESLVTWLQTLQESDPDRSLADMVNSLLLSDILDRQKQDEQENVVNLMTMHAAKGLEFRNVYIVGVEEDILPHRVSIADDAIEEERRLFYVGITRAMRCLSISYCQVRRRFGETLSCEMSRFLEELPADDLVFELPEKQADSEPSKNTGRAFLANMRSGRGSD